jgi:acyl carrier protein
VASGPVEEQALRTFLAGRLPGYMVPAHFVRLDKLPLTPNGKLDRKALPDVSETNLPGRDYVAPRNDLEKALVNLWGTFLGVHNVGINDNFFELGGHSLSALRLATVIKKELNLVIPVGVIFQASTIASLSQWIEISHSSKKEENYQEIFF